MPNITHNLGGIIVDDIVCINLKKREDRRTKFKRMSKKKGFPFRIYRSQEDKVNPEAARWQAHINIWKQFMTNKVKYGVVFEDDSQILLKKLLVHQLPYVSTETNSTDPGLYRKYVKPDMLYLGGNVQCVFKDPATDNSPYWKRVSCLTTHAYIIHRDFLGDLIRKCEEALKDFIKGEEGVPKSLSEWFCTKIHPYHKVYMATPDFVIQRNGYSDVRKKDITYNQTLTETVRSSEQIQNNEDSSLPSHIDIVPIVQNTKEGTVSLQVDDIKDEDLPHVTLITPTRNNTTLFPLIIRDFYKLTYPKEKLNWIIADDGDDDQKVKDIPGFPNQDQRISYVNCKMNGSNFLPISKKLNICISYALSSAYAAQDDNHIIVHFFDDQYHFPSSVNTRVKCLIGSNKSSNGVKKCVGCTQFGIFDYINNQSYQKFYPDINGNRTMLHSPSLTYYLKWYEERKFEEDKYTLESFYFTRNRLKDVVEIPYNFVSIGLVSGNPDKSDADRYGKSNTKTSIQAKYTARRGDKGFHNFFDGWDKETQNFILLTKELEKE